MLASGSSAQEWHSRWIAKQAGMQSSNEITWILFRKCCHEIAQSYAKIQVVFFCNPCLQSPTCTMCCNCVSDAWGLWPGPVSLSCQSRWSSGDRDRMLKQLVSCQSFKLLFYLFRWHHSKLPIRQNHAKK